MPNIKFEDILGGCYPDIPAHSLQAREWSYLNNCRTWVRSIEKVGGWVNEFTYTLGLSAPRLMFFWLSINSGGTEQGYFVYALGGAIRRISPLGDSNIALGGGPYLNAITGTAISNSVNWEATAFSGGYNIVVNNGNITPQYMNGDASMLSDLPGWVYGSINGFNVQATTTRVIRAFRNKLIAGNFTHRLANGTIVQRPSTIRISDNSAPGGIPQEWQPTAQNAADEFELTTTDPIVDIVILRNYALVLCTNSMWLVGDSTSGSATPVTQISTVRGCIGTGAVTVVDSRAYVVTTDDIIVADGSQLGFQTLANDIIKNEFFENQLNINFQGSVFCKYHRYFNEIWIGYPSKNSTDGSCDKALVYSLDEKAWSFCDLPNIFDAGYGPTVGNNDTLRPWPVNTYNFNVQRLHFADANQLKVLDIGYARPTTVNPTGAYQMLLQKTFDFSEIQGLDASKVKNVIHIYPKLVGTGQATFTIKCFNAPFPNPIDWTTWDWQGTFDIGGSYPDFRVTPAQRGRYMALQIATEDPLKAQLSSFEFEIIPDGELG